MEGDGPIRVMNGLIIGNKQSPEINDKPGTTRRDEPPDYRLDYGGGTVFMSLELIIISAVYYNRLTLLKC